MRRSRPNKHGVYCHVETVEFARVGKHARAVAEVAFCEDGFRRAGYDLRDNDGGFTALPSRSDRIAFVSRVAAIDSIEKMAVEWFTKRLEAHSATIRKEAKAILKQISQRDRRGQIDMFPDFRMAV